MSTAQFKIGTSPYSDRGFDATNGQVLQLQLEDSPALDIQSCVYVQVGKSKGAPDVVFGNGGVASPPTVAVSCTMPASGAHSYHIECRTNGGARVRGTDGKWDYSQNVKQRIVSIRTATANVRKMLIAESTQYSPTGGWSDAQNEMADQVEQAVSAVASVASSAAKLAVVAASTTNVDLSSTVASVNAVAISINDRVALLGQTAGAENGLYVKGSDNKLTRSADADTSAEVTPGIAVPVQQGTNRGTWTLATTGVIALGSTSLRFVKLSPQIDVRLFGALGNWAGTPGSGTDDTAAFNAAIAAAISSGFGVVLVPPGLYRITSTITIGAAVTLLGMGHPSGGIAGQAAPFSFLVHDFDGDFFVVDGHLGGAGSSGGGFEQLRFVQVYGVAADATPRGSAIVLTGVDSSHRAAWVRIRKCLIEEGGFSPWTWGIKIDGTPVVVASTQILPDLYISEVSSHTSAGSSGALLIKNASVTVDTCQFYLNGNVTIDGTSNASGATCAASCTLTNVKGQNLAFMTCLDCQETGGAWNSITAQAFDGTAHTGTGGISSARPLRYINGLSHFVNDSPNPNPNFGFMQYMNALMGNAAGAWEFSKGVMLAKNGASDSSGYVYGQNQSGSAFPLLIGLHTDDTIRIGVDGTKSYLANKLFADADGVNIPGLTASQVVVTDASKYLGSLAYTAAATAGTIALRDGSGGCVFVALTASTLALTGAISIGGVDCFDVSGTTIRVGFNGTDVDVDLYAAGNVVLRAAQTKTQVFYGGHEEFAVDADAAYVNGGAGLGSGSGLVSLHNATTAPTTNPSSGALVYAEGGALKARSSGGIVTILVPNTSPSYTVTNHTDSRSLDETGATLVQLAHVVGTLIQDLQALKLAIQ